MSQESQATGAPTPVEKPAEGVAIPIGVKAAAAAEDQDKKDLDMDVGGGGAIGEEEKKKSAPSNARLALNLKAEANAKYNEGNLIEAIELYTKALALDPRNHVLLSNRSLARWKSGMTLAAKGESQVGETTKLFRASLEDALACIDLKPDFPRGYVRAGQALRALGQTDTALQVYEASLSRFPNDPALLQERDETKKLCEQSRAEFPLSTQFLLNTIQTSSLQRHPNEPKLSEAEEELTPSERDRLLYSLFGSRYALVPSHSPKQQWTFFYGEPPNRRTAANWMPHAERRFFPQQDVDMGASSRGRGRSAAAPSPQQPRYSPRQQSGWEQQGLFVEIPPYMSAPRPSFDLPSPSADTWQFDLEREAPHHAAPGSSSFASSPMAAGRGVKRARVTGSSELRGLCDQLRISQYYQDLLRQGVETVDDLLCLPPDSIRQLIPTLGHQARVIDFIRRAQI